MASDREQFLALVQRGDIISAKVPEALSEAGIAPDLARWRTFIDNLLLWLGASTMAAGVLFFVAYNWEAMGRFTQFGLIQALIVVAVCCYAWFGGKKERIGKVSLFVASILLGVLLALYGQTYQTGADPWQLFAVWAVLMLPWAVIARFTPLWLMFIALLNIAFMLYCSTFRPSVGVLLNSERTVGVGLLLLNGLALLIWEWRMPYSKWLQDVWSPRLLAIAACIPFTLVAIEAILSRFDSLVPVLVLVWSGLAVLMVYFYRYRRPDLFMLAAACFAGGAVVLAFLIAQVFDRFTGGGGQFLFMAIAIIAMGTGAAVWLRKTQKAMFEEAG
ncbi:MAG: DUF2157 domain-containing protein [Gammaproteobacteria bacterium]